MQSGRRELRLSDRSRNGLCPLERFVESVSEPLYFDLTEPWEFFESFRRGVGDVSETLT